MSNWEKLDDVSKSIADEPWSMYWREFNTEADEFKKFMNDPLGVLSSEIGGVGKDWTIHTTIIGHQIGLTRGAVCNPMIVDPTSKSIYMTLYKHS